MSRLRVGLLVALLLPSFISPVAGWQKPTPYVQTVGVAESEFSTSSLWPPSNHRWMAPGAIRGTSAQYGKGLDQGALRVVNGRWEILWSKTPTREDQSNSAWVPFNPRQVDMLHAANAFRRWGPGWSYGPGHNMHSEVLGMFIEVYGRVPSTMEQGDIEHDQSLYKALVRDYKAKLGAPPIDEQPVVTPPVVVVPPPVVTPPVVTMQPGLTVEEVDQVRQLLRIISLLRSALCAEVKPGS